MRGCGFVLCDAFPFFIAACQQSHGVAVAGFGSSLVEAVGLTKMVNFVNSLAATAVFVAERRIDWTVGIAMSLSMIVGGFVGAHLAIARGTGWVRRVFVLTVIAMAISLLWDALHARHHSSASGAALLTVCKAAATIGRVAAGTSLSWSSVVIRVGFLIP